MTWVLVGAIAVLRGPLTPVRLAIGVTGLAFAVLAALLTKRTTLAVVLAALLVIVVVATPLIRHWLRPARLWVPTLIVATIVVGVLSAAVVGFDERTARDWTGGGHVRVASDGPGRGRVAARIGDAPANALISQPLSRDAITAIRGQPIAAGAWFRLANPLDAPRPVTIRFEQRVGGQTRAATTPVTVGPEWTFASVQTNVSPDVTSGAFTVTAPGTPAAAILVDGAALATGAITGAPTAASSGPTVTWDGQRVTNWLANPSFEDSAFGVQPWLQDAITSYVGRPFDQIAASLFRSI